MTDIEDRKEKLNKLAQDVLRLSRNTLLVNLRFLDAALSQFEEVRIDESSFATDGHFLFYNPKHILGNYRLEKEIPVRDYLHVVMHCIFQHMYGAPNLERSLWDLACDIAVEYSISELGLGCVQARRQARQEAVYAALKKELKFLTAEKIYRYYQDKNLTPMQLADIRSLFYADNHEFWYLTIVEIEVRIGLSLSGAGQSDDQESNSEDNQDGDSENHGNSSDSSENDDSDGMGARGQQAQIWKDISEQMQMDLETFSKQQGDKAGGLMQNLNAVNREKYDYTEFLKKFAVTGEVMKINDDEFDYIFYTYGLQLYEKMPLIEPLEYKDVKRIREFVIAIDTSGSTSGELVQRFVQKTYNILKSTESFFSKINLHIIQCDAEIQEDVKITSQEEFDKYLKTMKIHGLGGTDFRPVFSYVNQLVKEREFRNLRGLIYFTDGYGNFPERMPDYQTAFVFVDDEYNNPNVPSWAIKLVLQRDEI